MVLKFVDVQFCDTLRHLKHWSSCNEQNFELHVFSSGETTAGLGISLLVTELIRPCWCTCHLNSHIQGAFILCWK